MAKDTETIPCQPIGELILVKLIMETESAGGISLPVKQIRYGIVKAIGKAIDPKYLGENGFNIGDKVFLPRGDAGNRFGENNEYLLTQISNISAVMKT